MFRLLIGIIISLCLYGCGKYEDNSVKAEELGKALAYTMGMREWKIEDLRNISLSSVYGIAPEEIEAGYAYYATKPGDINKVIIVKSKDRDGRRNTELALEAWGNSQAQAYKYRSEKDLVERGIIKTRGMYTVVLIGEGAEEAVSVFDSMIK